MWEGVGCYTTLLTHTFIINWSIDKPVKSITKSMMFIFFPVWNSRCEFLARLGEVKKSLCTTPGVGVGVNGGVGIYVKVL